MPIIETVEAKSSFLGLVQGETIVVNGTFFINASTDISSLSVLIGETVNYFTIIPEADFANANAVYSLTFKTGAANTVVKIGLSCPVTFIVKGTVVTASTPNHNNVKQFNLDTDSSVTINHADTLEIRKTDKTQMLVVNDVSKVVNSDGALVLTDRQGVHEGYIKILDHTIHSVSEDRGRRPFNNSTQDILTRVLKDASGVDSIAINFQERTNYGVPQPPYYCNITALKNLGDYVVCDRSTDTILVNSYTYNQGDVIRKDDLFNLGSGICDYISQTYLSADGTGPSFELIARSKRSSVFWSSAWYVKAEAFIRIL